MARYFNLKLGSKNVFGGVIKVDLDESDIGRKVQEFYETEHYRFRHVKSGIYELSVPNGKYVPTTRVPVFVEEGSPSLLRIGLTEDGELRLVNKIHGKRAYIFEISESQAIKLKEDKRCFDMLRAYVCK